MTGFHDPRLQGVHHAGTCWSGVRPEDEEDNSEKPKLSSAATVLEGRKCLERKTRGGTRNRGSCCAYAARCRAKLVEKKNCSCSSNGHHELFSAPARRIDHQQQNTNHTLRRRLLLLPHLCLPLKLLDLHGWERKAKKIASRDRVLAELPCSYRNVGQPKRTLQKRSV